MGNRFLHQSHTSRRGGEVFARGERGRCGPRYRGRPLSFSRSLYTLQSSVNGLLQPERIAFEYRPTQADVLCAAKILSGQTSARTAAAVIGQRSVIGEQRSTLGAIQNLRMPRHLDGFQLGFV